MKKYTAVLFDLDRTLWDFEENSKNTFSDIYNKYNLNSFFKDFDSFLSIYMDINEKLWDDYRKGHITKEILRYKRFMLTLKKVGIINETLAKHIGDDYVNDSPLKKELLPNAIETLEYLFEKYDLYIITNGFKEVQIKKMDNTNLIKYFKKVFISEDIGIQKPNPGIFTYVLNEINTKPGKCIMIGDDIEADIHGAKNVGIDQVWFNPKKLPATIVPNYEISDLLDLVEILGLMDKK